MNRDDGNNLKVLSIARIIGDVYCVPVINGRHVSLITAIFKELFYNSGKTAKIFHIFSVRIVNIKYFSTRYKQYITA